MRMHTLHALSASIGCKLTTEALHKVCGQSAVGEFKPIILVREFAGIKVLSCMHIKGEVLCQKTHQQTVSLNSSLAPSYNPWSAMQPLLTMLEELLTCTMCLDKYTDPKQLQCHHVFCQQCLRQLDIAEKHATCPICYVVTAIPANGLPPAFQTNQFLEFLEMMTKASPLCSPPTRVSEKGLSSLTTSESQLLAQAQVRWRLQRHHKKRKKKRIVRMNDLAKVDY